MQSPLRITLLAVAFATATHANTDSPVRARVSDQFANLPLHFEKNVGQTDRRALYTSRGYGATLFVVRDGAVLALPKAAVAMRIIGANVAARVDAEMPLPGTSNYLLGNSAEAWKSGIAQYGKVSIRRVLPGIDVSYHGTHRDFEYDFIVQPKADPSSIRLRFDGASSRVLNPNGDLVLRVGETEIVQHKPVAWQDIAGERKPVEVRYVLDRSSEVRIATAAYDRSQPLIIDPVISYSTFLGGSGDDGITGIAVDATGAAYVTGYTRSTDFPVTTGAYQSAVGNAAYNDAFVAKLSSDGRSLLYSTYIGGSNSDSAAGICVDAAGNAYIAGSTYSTNFPTTSGAFQTSMPPGYTAAFVLKVNATGSALLFSTYLAGTTSYASAAAIALDAAGSVYVAGKAAGTTFPTTAGVVKTTLSAVDGFVTKLNVSGSALLYSTLVGGGSDDWVNGIAVDSGGNAYITGYTLSANFPVTTNAYDQTFGGNNYSDVFVAKLNDSATQYVYATYLGGTNSDVGNAIAIDGTGAAYITGQTNSSGFPTTAGSFAPTGIPYGYADAFVTKLNAAGTDLVYSTYLGGASEDMGTAIVVSNGEAFVVGSTSASDFPTTPGALQPARAGSSRDAFLARLNMAGSALSYSTYLGSGNYESGNAIGLDAAGNVYIAGNTTSANFPVSAGAYQMTNSDSLVPPYSATTTGFITKLDFTSSQQCSTSISSTSYNAPLSGGSFSFSVTAPNGCPWEAFVTSDYYYGPTITFNGPSRGLGNGTVSFTVAPNNNSTNARTGSIQVGASRLTVTQPAGSCTDPLLTPASRTFDGNGGLVNVSVMLPSGCQWTASPSAPWIQINSGSPGNGSGTTSVYVAPNDFAARSGTINIASKTVSVTQSGNDCTAISGGTTSFGSAGGTGVMTLVTSAPTCRWSAYALANWIRLDPENTSGLGQGIIPFTVAPNYGGVSRSGAILAADRTLIVTQSAGPAGVPSSYLISTYAGGNYGLGDGGPATSANLNSPYGMAYDTAGNLYIADRYHYRVRRVSTDGMITTFAGNGSAASNGDGGPATSASLYAPYGVAVDAAGNVYVSESNRIRKIDTNGIISTFAGTGIAGFSGDYGPATSANLNYPTALAFDNAGVLYIADTNNQRIRYISGGSIYTLAGTAASGFSGDGGLATSAQLNGPMALASAPGQGLYIADQANCRVRRVYAGIITTVAGNGSCSGSSSGDGGAATSAAITPTGLAFDVSGNLLIADSSYNGRIRRVSGGVISTIGGGGNSSGEAVPATSVNLYYPQQLATDTAGNIVVSDWYSDRVWRLTPADSFCAYVADPNNITVAGSGGTAYVGIATSANCRWQVLSSAPWVTNPAGDQTGSGRAALQIAANSGTARTGTVTVAGQNITVSQAASNCTIALAPAGVSSASGAGASIAVNVTTGAAGCSWSASSSADWITVETAPKTGSQSLTITLAANTGLRRTGSVSIGGQLFSVEQSAGVAGIAGLRFIPVTPCRVLDTRNPDGPFGGPALGANGTRTFNIPSSSCAIPSTAAAFSVNVTAVPTKILNYLAVWPAGKPQPLASTLNSLDGRIKANAAIVPAGDNGGISIFATDPTHVVVDINGYFVPETDATALAFYPMTPCRIADTRNPAGTFGAPSLAANVPRVFPILSSGCSVPADAQAYSLNFTAVPKRPLNYLSTWPTGQSQPFVSTLNALTGAITANAAIVPAGSGGAVNVFATDDSDLVIDINGYFAPAGANGLSLYNLTPCRILDTREPAGSPARTGTFDVNVSGSSCNVPTGAKAYVLNATVVPPKPLPFLTLWPQGSNKPWVSTLNAVDGAITSNMAIVPTLNDSISAYHESASHLVLDISGYFGQSAN